MKVIKLNKISIVFSFLFLFVSNDSFASPDPCTPCTGENQKQIQDIIQCTGEGTTATADANAGAIACGTSQIIGSFLSGSKALINSPDNVLADRTNAYGIDTMKDEMSAHGEKMAENIQARSEKIVESYNKMTSDLMTFIIDSNLKYSEMVTNIEENNLTARMEYQSDLEASAARANGNIVGTGTSEEIEFILNELDNANTEHTPVVIAKMKAKYDSNEEFKIPVRYKHTEGLSQKGSIDCPKYDPKNLGELTDYSCYKALDANPGQTLEVYFKECSLNKARELAKLQEKGSSKVQGNEIQEESKKNFNSTLSAQSVVNQKIVDDFVACTEEQIILGNCELKENYSTPEEYRQKLIADIIDNEIVVNGSTSSLNLLTPEVVGSLDGNINLTEEEYKSFLKKAGEVNNVAVSTNTPELISTYKTSSQFMAAKGFANNIIGESIVSNIQPERRNDLNTSTFVSSLKQRQAMLNLAKVSYAKSIAARVGKNLSEKVFNGELDHRGDVIKEDINGAGKIDNLRHQVEKDFEEVADRNVPSGYESGNYNLKAKIYESEVKKARLNMESYLHWGQIELMLAAKLVEQANSMENKQYIRNLKNN